MAKVISDYPDNIKSRKALVRCNFDVPFEDGRVKDATRIEDSFSTIRHLLDLNCTVGLIAHQDRPGGKYVKEKTLLPVIGVLNDLLDREVKFVDYEHTLEYMPDNDDVILFENVRFFGEEKGGSEKFAEKLASGWDVYVNESFATSHRDHASITKLPKIIPGYLGLSFYKEIETLNKVIEDPSKPLVLVLGGAKIETKEPLINKFVNKADYILVGGKIALDMQGRKDLPHNVILAKLNDNDKDIDKESAKKFAEIIGDAATVIWNGTMGVFEEPPNDTGTKIVAEAVNSTSAYTLVGGGDTETAMTVLNTEDNISHISTGGGAMLKYLHQGTLVGIQAME